MIVEVLFCRPEGSEAAQQALRAPFQQEADEDLRSTRLSCNLAYLRSEARDIENSGGESVCVF